MDGDRRTVGRFTTTIVRLYASYMLNQPDPTPPHAESAIPAQIREIFSEADDLIEALERRPEAPGNHAERRREERDERDLEARERRRERARQADELTALAREQEQHRRELARGQADERETPGSTRREYHRLQVKELAARADDERETLRERHRLERAERGQRQIAAQVKRAFARGEDAFAHSDARQLATLSDRYRAQLSELKTAAKTHDGKSPDAHDLRHRRHELARQFRAQEAELVRDQGARRRQRSSDHERKLGELRRRLADDVKHIREGNTRRQHWRKARLAEAHEIRKQYKHEVLRPRAARGEREPAGGERAQPQRQPRSGIQDPAEQRDKRVRAEPRVQRPPTRGPRRTR